MRRLSLRLTLSLLICISCCACPSVLQPTVDPSKHPALAPSLIVYYYISSDFDYEEKVILLQAMERWSKATGYRVAWQHSDKASALYIGAVWTRNDLPGVDHPNTRYIAVTLPSKSQIFIVMDGEMNAEMLRVVAAHEFGHYLGLSHQPDGTLETCMTSCPWDGCLRDGEVPRTDRINFCRLHNCDTH